MKDVGAAITAIVDACAEFPELKQPEVLKLVLTTLGMNNVDDIMKRVLITAKQNQLKADNIANGLNPDGTKKRPDQLAGVLPTPVVGPAKPAQQKTAPGGQPIAATVKEAAEWLAYVLQCEAEELDDAVKPEESEAA